MQQRAFRGTLLLLAVLACAITLGATDPHQPGSTGHISRPKASSAHAAHKPDSQAASDGSDDLFCVVVRTYWRHGSYGDNALIDLVHSLKAQKHQKWVALLLVMDNRPFPELRHIVRDFNDSRVWVFAEWISSKYAPRLHDGSSWTHNYHSKLYNLTDEGVRACPRNTDWLMVTNGDNLYDPSFMTEVLNHRTADVVTLDYYSRFQRVTAPQCERFAVAPGAPPCKTNGMRWCHTDLGAAVWYWPKFVQENMRYGPLDQGFGVGHDGAMAELAGIKGWKAAHVPGRCLLNHSPSPQQCALANGTWDDTEAPTQQGTGGRCLPEGQGEWVARDLGSKVEVLQLEITHDGSSFGLKPDQVLRLPCIRLKDPRTHADMERFFSPRCRSAYDSGKLGAQGEAGVLRDANQGGEEARRQLESMFGINA